MTWEKAAARRGFMGSTRIPSRPVDARDITGVYLFDPRENGFLAGQVGRLERVAQDGGSQTAAGGFGEGGKAEVPGFRLYAGEGAAGRAKEAEPGGVRLEPLGKRGEGAGRGVLGRNQLNPVARRQCAAVDEIQVGSPMMAARARQRGPMKNGVDALGRGQAGRLEDPALGIVQRRLPAPFAVPDRELARKVAEGARGG